MSTFRAVCRAIKKLSQSIETKSTWLRSGRSATNSSSSTSGAMVFSVATMMSRTSCAFMIGSPSQLFGMLQQFVDLAQEQRPPVSVAGAMVRGQTGDHRSSDTELTSLRPRALLRLPESHQRHLGWVDDPEHRVDTLVAEIGHGQGRVGHL